jgi:hypothetical protein
MRPIGLLILLFFTAAYCPAQELDNLMKVTPVWAIGKLVLQEGEVVTGELFYDELQSVLHYRAKYGDRPKLYTSNDVASFELEDRETNKKRTFYAFDFEDPEKNVLRPLFFEVIQEYREFAVLLKTDPAEFNQQVGTRKSAVQQQNAMQTSGHVMRAQQVQTLCFMDTKGLIEPYVSIEIREIDGMLTDRVVNKHKTLDKTLPEKYFGKAEYQKMRQYAKENSLDLDKLPDFLKVISYFSTLAH